ncbi:ABC-three component system protein [Jatrophihabitans sp. DSM 45814]
MAEDGAAAPTTKPKSLFDASAAAAGYAMQMRYALLRALELLRVGVDWQISVEAGDDVELVSANGYRSLFQIKHRAPGTTLTNASSDLWKTLRIWAESVNDQTIELPTSHLFLVTTSTAVQGTIAEYLVADGERRNVDVAVAELNAIADAGGSQSNAKSYAAWTALTDAQRLALLDRVTVVPESPDIDAVKDLLHDICGLSVRRSQISAFVSRLEGWWFQRCIEILRATSVAYVTGDEFDAFVSDMREAFLPENLPIDSDVPLLEPDTSAFTDHLFVAQIGWAGVGTSRIASAVRDYLRAYTQRSRWTRDSLVGPDELDGYERRLVEEWRYVFDRYAEELSADSSEAAKTAVAREIYRWVEEATAPPIREHCTERFLVRGSLHMLADRSETGVGWHPEFAARLMGLLEPALTA